MHDTETVRTTERIQHLADQRDRVGRREPAGPGEYLAEVAALDILHCQVGISLVHREVIHGDDVRVGTASGRLRLVAEAGDILGTFVAPEQVRPDQLDRHLAVDRRIMRQIDHAHRAAAEQTLDAIAADRDRQGGVGNISSPAASWRSPSCAAYG